MNLGDLRQKRRRALALGLLALAACRPPEPPRSGAAGRFADQVRAAEVRLGPWQPWFEELARLDGADRFDDVLCHRQATQRLLWDAAVAAPLADASRLEQCLATSRAETCRGPLLTLVDFRRQLDQVGVDLLVVIIPPAAAVYPELFGDSAPLAAGETPPLLDRHLRAFYAALEAAGVEVLDLLPAFLERRFDGPLDGDRRELLYRWQDTHWTAHGAAVAGAAIAERVERYPWFSEVAAGMGEARWQEYTAWEEQHGSVVRHLLRQGRLAAGTPKERVRRVRVRIEGERWSFEDRASPVLLLGDSFSLPQYGLPDQLLKHLGFRVDPVTVGGGLGAGALKALRFRGDRLAGKRLVIWEITAYALAEDWRPVDVLGRGEQ